MRILKKMVIALVLAMVAVSAISLFTGSVSAASGLSFQASISSKSSAVAQNTSYTFVLTNTGAVSIGSANITVPSGYSKIGDLVIAEQPVLQNWTVTLQTITTNSKTSYFILLYGSTQGLVQSQAVAFTFDARNPLPEGTYNWVVGINGNTSATGVNVPQSITVTKSSSILITSLTSALLILVIALGIAFINTALNRFLINYFIGWEQYRVMQKEMNEYRQETMAAARSKDTKQMEKLKKRQSQINNMQAKMLKPQMVQLGISFLYIFIWIFVLTPTYGITSMVYLPGLGAISVVYWYPICSFFLGLLASRIIGIMPIEP
jgi:uncharacterized membrane protein (DUF106 family)